MSNLTQITRRELLTAGAMTFSASSWLSRAILARPDESDDCTFETHRWIRDPHNPILPPKVSFDSKRCMNPFLVRRDNEYFLFYSGGDSLGRHRICVATAPVDDLSEWKRHGPLFEIGGKGAFDELWCVLPCVHKFGDRWHLYYTGHGTIGAGLQSFRGIGLATSEDFITWKKWSDEPVLKGDGFDRWHDNNGIAGGGSLIEIPQADGRILYRMYYTLAVGTPSPDLLFDQAKYSVAADSWDGINWFDRRVVLEPRLDAKYENAATIGLTVWKEGELWRAVYAGIGTQFGAYSICEAESEDGLIWRRGKPGENLAIPPIGTGWESQMTTYPNIVQEGDKLRLFYCGNGYGSTGIGTATANWLHA